jgi:hypothetical protein
MTNDALQEAIQLNLFKEYKALKAFKDKNDFQMGRFLVFEAVLDMIRFDPINGDMKEDMTIQEQNIWSDIESKIKQGCKLLNGGDPLLWSFIPRRFYRDISNFLV